MEAKREEEEGVEMVAGPEARKEGMVEVGAGERRRLSAAMARRWRWAPGRWGRRGWRRRRRWWWWCTGWG